MSQQLNNNTSATLLSHSNLSEEIRQCLSPLLETINVIPSVNSQILTALSSLHQMLEQKLDRIAVALERPTHVLSTSAMPNKLSNTYGETPSVLTELRDLKNSRYDSVDKHLMNSIKINVYGEGLQQSPQQIPHKLHEKTHRTDNDAIKTIKLKKSVQNVELEIEKMQIHQNIHRNKVMKIDAKAHEVISKVQDSDTREKYTKNWSSIVLRHEENLKKKWQEKMNFLKSERHMMKLGSYFPPANAYRQQTQHSSYSNQNKGFHQKIVDAANHIPNKVNEAAIVIDEPMSYSEAARYQTSSLQRIKKLPTSIQDQKNVTHIPRPPRPKRLQSRY